MRDIYSSRVDKKGKVTKSPSGSKKKMIKKQSPRQKIYRLVGSSRGTVGAFVARPKRVSFDGQEPEEKIILLLRQHPIVNVKWFSLVIIMAIVPLLLGGVPLLKDFPARFYLASIILWYLLTIAFAVEQSLAWLFNIGIITTNQAIDIDFFSLTNKRITEAEINKIQDVTSRFGGILQTFFNYGSVYIQTAGEKPELEFVNIPNPTLVADVIEKLRLEKDDKTHKA